MKLFSKVYGGRNIVVVEACSCNVVEGKLSEKEDESQRREV
jgi:hypothetical protein